MTKVGFIAIVYMVLKIEMMVLMRGGVCLKVGEWQRLDIMPGSRGQRLDWMFGVNRK